MKRRYVFGIVLLLAMFLVLCVAAVAEADGAATEFSAGKAFTVEGRTIRTTAIDNDLTIQFGNGTVQTVQANIPLKDMYCILKDEIVLVQELNSNWYNGTGTELTINNKCKVTAGTLNPESRVVLLETDGKMHAFSAGTGTGNDKLVIGETLDLRDCIKTAHLGIGVDEEWRIDLTSEIRIDIPRMGYVSFTGSYLKTRIKGDFSFPKTKIEDYTCEFHSDKISVCLTDSQPLSREFTIVKIRKGLAYGLYLDFSPTLSIEKTGKGQVDFTFTGREGFYTDLYIVPSIPPVFYPTGADWKHTKPTFQVTSVDVEGEFYAGPSWGMQLGWGKDLQIGPTMKWGKVFRAELSKSHFSPSSPDIWHACEPYKCVEGTSFFREGPFAVTASVAGYGFTILPLIAAKDHPPDLAFFKSLTFRDWGFTLCPHKAYRLLVYAERKGGGMPPERVRVDYSVIPEHYEEAASGYTKGYEAAQIFVPEGRYTVTGTAVSPADPSRKVTVKQEIDKHKRQEVMVLDFDLPLATLTFDANIGEPVRYMPDPRTKTVDPFFSPKVYITSYAPEVVSGRVSFLGWNTAADGSGTMYAPGSTVTVEKDMTLYAQWSFAQDSWYIVYNANGGEKAPLGQVIPKGQAAVLTDEIAWWDSDIYFLGWSTEPDAIDPEYKPGDTVPYQQDVSFLMLYAVWKFPPTKPPVEIRYDANGVAGAEVPEKTWVMPYTWIELGDALPPFGGKDRFLGWNTDPNARVPAYKAGEFAQFGEDTVLYAVWMNWDDKVTLDFKDSLTGPVSGLPEAISFIPSMSPIVEIPDDIPQKAGMAFTGWNTAADGSGEGYAPGGTIVVSEDTTLYAQWTPLGDYWYIIYNAAGGADAPLTQIIRKGQDAVLSAEVPFHIDWTFRGWSRDREAEQPEFDPGDTLPFSESEPFVVLYAVWEKHDNRLEVTFDTNGGKAGTQPGKMTVQMMVWTRLPGKMPSWDPQHDFLGWDTDPEATEPLYKAGGMALFMNNTVLYAIWYPHYRIIQGAGSTWVKDSKKDHRFAADGNIAYFTEFRFDGKALDSSEYKATSGSTIIDVSAAAMQKLSVGKHTVEVVYQDGSASAEFTVSKKTPKTGDAAELLLWNGLVLLGIAGLVFVMRQYHSEKRKKKALTR